MTASAETDARLYDTEGFVVESSEGDLGWVEEIWIGEENAPRALAVRTKEGRHGLLLGEDVLTVDRENHWVVVPPEPTLLELDTPRLVTAEDADEGRKLSASWSTTGAVLRVSPRRRPLWRFRLPHRKSKSRVTKKEPPLWKAVAVLLTSLALAVAFVITLAFLVARLVTGSAY